MKKFLAAVLLALLVSPVFADDAVPAAAAPAADDQAAPAAEMKAKKAKPAGDEAGIQENI